MKIIKEDIAIIGVCLWGVICFKWYLDYEAKREARQEKKNIDRFKEYVKNNPIEEPTPELAKQVYGLSYDEPYLD